MSGGEKTTTVTQAANEPWAAAQPYLEGNLSSINAIYTDPFYWAPYQGDTTIPFSSQSTSAFNAAENVANSYIGTMQDPLNAFSSMVGSTQPLAEGNFAGSIYDQSKQLRDSIAPAAFGDFTNDSAFTANLAKSQQDAAEQVNMAMSGAGRYGSGQHTDTLATSIMDATNQAMQDYQQMAIDNYRGLTSDLSAGQNNAATQLLSFGQAMPDAYTAALAPSSTLRDVGSQYENLSANYAQEAMDDYYAWQNIGKQNLAEQNALYSGVGGLGSTSYGSQTATTPGTSTSQLLGTGLAGTSYLMEGK